MLGKWNNMQLPMHWEHSCFLLFLCMDPQETMGCWNLAAYSSVTSDFLGSSGGSMTCSFLLCSVPGSSSIISCWAERRPPRSTQAAEVWRRLLYGIPRLQRCFKKTTECCTVSLCCLHYIWVPLIPWGSGLFGCQGEISGYLEAAWGRLSTDNPQITVHELQFSVYKFFRKG